MSGNWIFLLCLFVNGEKVCFAIVHYFASAVMSTTQLINLMCDFHMAE